MYTSIVLAALMSPGDASENKAAEHPRWQDNYTEARKMGLREKKPLAVFVGSGTKGWEQLSLEGKLTADVQQRLGRDYVCVFVDADTERGKRLAEAFAMRQGLVVSTRDGDSQAFRHSGRMSARDLEATLTRYANGPAVSRTETLEQPRASYSYVPPTPAPARAAYPSTFGGFGGFGGFSGGGFSSGGGSC